MLKYFSLDNNKRIYLWGNTSYAVMINSYLKENHVINGIIEKTGIGIKGIDLVKYEDVRSVLDKNEVVFILCLRSGLNQEKLARSLYEDGFKNIVFAPLTVGNSDIAYQMRENYNLLMYGGNEKEFFPTYDCLINEDCKVRIIKEYKDSLELLVDIKYLRTFYRDTVDEKMLQYRDKHISEYDCLNELYDYFYNDGVYPNDYIGVYMQLSDGEKILKDRKMLFESFKAGVKGMGWRFFESMPIPVECKENGLNIKNGMHRASFLFKSGAKQVPIVASKEDFYEFLNLIEENDEIN